MAKNDIYPFDDSMTLEEFQQEVDEAKIKLKANNL